MDPRGFSSPAPRLVPARTEPLIRGPTRSKQGQQVDIETDRIAGLDPTVTADRLSHLEVPELAWTHRLENPASGSPLMAEFNAELKL